MIAKVCSDFDKPPLLEARLEAYMLDLNLELNYGRSIMTWSGS